MAKCFAGTRVSRGRTMLRPSSEGRLRLIMSRRSVLLSGFLVVCAAAATAAGAGEWARWRGPSQNGVSADTGLVSSWTVNGENQLWRAEFIGRSTPVAFDGRVCAVGRTGHDISKQEVVTCWDAETGKALWEHRFNVY